MLVSGSGTPERTKNEERPRPVPYSANTKLLIQLEAKIVAMRLSEREN
jgi:hypothetical protein